MTRFSLRRTQHGRWHTLHQAVRRPASCSSDSLNASGQIPHQRNQKDRVEVLGLEQVEVSSKLGPAVDLQAPLGCSSQQVAMVFADAAGWWLIEVFKRPVTLCDAITQGSDR